MRSAPLKLNCTRGADPDRSVLGTTGAASETGLECRDRDALVSPGHHTAVVAVGAVALSQNAASVMVGRSVVYAYPFG